MAFKISNSFSHLKIKELKKNFLNLSNCPYYVRPQYQSAQKRFSLMFLLRDMVSIFQVKPELSLAKYISNSIDEALCCYSKSDKLNNVLHLI